MKTAVGPVVRLTPASTVFLLCDVQERFRAAIHGFANVVVGSQRMLQASKELSIPTIVTEQYPKGLLKTVEELDVAGIALEPYEEGRVGGRADGALEVERDLPAPHDGGIVLMAQGAQ